MKRALLVITLTAATSLWAQQPAASAQSGSTQSGSTPPSGSAQSGAANSGQAGAATPQGKRPPQAKTQPEFDAYQAAIANMKDPAAMEKSADDFAAKFPTSDLRVLLYRGAMNSYQSANNADKMMEMGRKILSLDPNDPEAALGVAQVLAERTRDTDLDKEQRYDEAAKMAQHALETIDTDVAAPAGTPPEKLEAYKRYLKSTAYAVIGTIQFDQEKFAESESTLHKSIDADPSQPDPVAILRLALALDKQDKYPEALQQATKVVAMTQESTNIGSTARREQDRLQKLTSTAPGASTAPASTTPGSAPQTTTPPK
jgi:tetratricopeptide (TPR) repeat protein